MLTKKGALDHIGSNILSCKGSKDIVMVFNYFIYLFNYCLVFSKTNSIKACSVSVAILKRSKTASKSLVLDKGLCCLTGKGGLGYVASTFPVRGHARSYSRSHLT
jgi:predicted DNA-binding transcriptional regulator